MTNPDRSARVAGGIGLVALAAVAFLALVVGFPTANTVGGTGMMGGGMMGGSGGLPFVFFPFLFLALASLLALGYAGVRALASARGDDQIGEAVDGEEAPDPVARIQRRYTEGELTEAEFERALERELAGEGADGGGESDGGPERSASLRER